MAKGWTVETYLEHGRWKETDRRDRALQDMAARRRIISGRAWGEADEWPAPW
jgi:hypothetical protein